MVKLVVTPFSSFFPVCAECWMTLASLGLGLLQIYLHLVVFVLLLPHNIVMMLKRTWKGLINDHESWWHPDRRKTEDEMVFICGSRIDHFARIAAHFSLQFTISAARTLQLTEGEQLLVGSINHQLKIIQWHNSWMNLFSMIVDLCQYTHYQYCQSVELFRIVAFWLFPKGCKSVPSRSFVLLQRCSAACREIPASKNGTSMCIVIITIITTTGD